MSTKKKKKPKPPHLSHCRIFYSWLSKLQLYEWEWRKTVSTSAKINRAGSHTSISTPVFIPMSDLHSFFFQYLRTDTWICWIFKPSTKSTSTPPSTLANKMGTSDLLSNVVIVTKQQIHKCYIFNFIMFRLMMPKSISAQEAFEQCPL